MTDLFDNREKRFQAKFKLDQETVFKVDAWRNKLLEIWLAERLGLPQPEHAPYAQEVVLSDLEEPGVQDIIRKVLKDIEQHGAKIGESDIRMKLNEFRDAAIEQIANE